MDDYSGRIDWDDIYRTFHDPENIAERLRSRLRRVDGTLLFCGFPEVGARLARRMPVRLVDGSAAVVARSRERYPVLERVDCGDVIDLLGVDPARSSERGDRLFGRACGALFVAIGAALLSGTARAGSRA